MGIKRVLRRFSVPFDVLRQPPIVRERGRVREGGEVIIIRAHGGIQPASPKDLERLPEGQRTNAAITIWSDCVLLTGDAPGTRADKIIPRGGNVFEGVTFEIQSAEPWPRHAKYIAIKVGQ